MYTDLDATCGGDQTVFQFSNQRCSDNLEEKAIEERVTIGVTKHVPYSLILESSMFQWEGVVKSINQTHMSVF